MMQNKLYKIIANIYNELKAFKGDKSSLEDAVVEIVGKNNEVLEARHGHVTLNDRLDDMQMIINNKSLDIIDVYDKINNAKNEAINKIPPAITQVLSDKDKDIIVSLDNKISRKEDILTVPGNGGTAVLTNENEFYVAKAYMNSLDSAVATKSIVFDNDTKVKYDKTIESLKSNSVVSNGISDLYEIPFTAVDILHTEEFDVCYLQNIATVVSDYSSLWSDSNNAINYSNHLVNAFRSGKEWRIDRSYIELVFTFTEPVLVTKFHSELDTTSTAITYSIDGSNDGKAWNNIVKGGGKIIDFTLPTSVSYKYIKFSVNSFDNVQGRNIRIKNTKVYSTKYNTVSSVVETLEPIILDFYNSNIRIVTKNTTDSHRLIENKYAISNETSVGGQNKKIWYTYIPNIMTIGSKLFKDIKGYRVVRDVIKNIYSVDINARTLLDLKVQTTSPVSDFYNHSTLGTCTVTRFSGSGQSISESNYAWKPSSLVVMKVEVVYKGVTYVVPLIKDNLDNVVTTNIGGIDFNITIRALSYDTLKVSIMPANGDPGIIADSVRVKFLTPYNQYSDKGTWNTTNSSSQLYNYTNLIKGHAYDITRVDCTYNVSHSWNDFFFWHNDPSPYNGTDNGKCCAILSKDIYSGSISKDQINDGYNITTVYEKRNCELPATVYLDSQDQNHLNTTIQDDVLNIETMNIIPRFVESSEYTAKQFIGDAKLTAILPQQTVNSVDSIKYAISFDGYNYYSCNENNNWIPYIGDNGMVISKLTNLNDADFNTIRNDSQWIWIKIWINGFDASVSNISLNFDKDKYIPITPYEIQSKGMSKDVIENMDPKTLQSTIFNLSPVLYIAQVADSDFDAYMYSLSGIDINDYKDVKWQEVDNVKVLEYLLGNGALMYKNTTAATLYVKVIRNLIENKSAVIDVRDETKDLIEQLEIKQTQLLDSVAALDQNLTLMHDTFINTGGVPVELPKVMLPNIKSYKTGNLNKNDEYVITDADTIRGIQVWEEKSNFVGYVDRLDFEATSSDNFSTSLIDILDTGAQISTDYDKDNPYLCPENVISLVGLTKAIYPLFDLTASVTPSINGVASVIEDGGTEKGFVWSGDGYSGFTFDGSRYNADRGYTAFWDLPGEKTRWVDIILDFRGMTWIDYLNNLYFGQWSPSGSSPSLESCTNQITTFSYSVDGLEYTDVATFVNYRRNANVNFNAELRYIRIRLELPYSVNKGAGRVTFTQMNVYFSPVHYIHDTDCYVFNNIPVDTEKWNNFNSISVDRFIDHNPCEMKFLLSDDPSHVVWKHWNGSTWVVTSTISIANSMSVETLLSLSSNQLNQLEKGSLYICAIMKTTDIWRTPILRSVEFKHDSFTTQNYYEMIDPHSIDIKHFLDNKTIVIRNNDNDVKKLKITLL